jgi:hypothetical protein
METQVTVANVHETRFEFHFSDGKLKLWLACSGGNDVCSVCVNEFI